MVLLKNDEIHGYILNQVVCSTLTETNKFGKIVRSEDDYIIFPIAVNVKEDTENHLLADSFSREAGKKFPAVSAIHLESPSARDSEYFEAILPEIKADNYQYAVDI